MNLLETLFVSVKGDLSDFTKSMAEASTDSVRQTGKIASSWNKLADVAGPAFKKIGSLAKVAVTEAKSVLANGLREAATAGVNAFSESMAEGDFSGALSNGFEAAISEGATALREGFASQVLPALMEQMDLMGTISKAAGGLKSAFAGLIPVIASLGKAFMALMFSPLGLIIGIVAAVVAAFVYWDDIVAVVEKVGKAISEWYTANIKPTMDNVIAAIQPVIDFFVDTFGGAIEAQIQFLSKIFSGDFAGAWEMVKNIAINAGKMILNAIGNMANGAIGYVQKLYQGVKSWIMDKLNGVWDWLEKKIASVTGFFKDMYIAVVGNSYVPDMVEQIGDNMKRLQSLMVDPAEKATKSTKDAFQELARDVGAMMDDLFPEFAALENAKRDLERWDQGKDMLDPDVYEKGRGELRRRVKDAQNDISASPAFATPEVAPAMIEISDAMQKLIDAAAPIPEIMSDVEIAFRDAGNRLGDEIMGGLHDVLDGKSLKDTLRDGLFNLLSNAMHNALDSLEDALFGEGGLGGFLGNVIGSLISGGGRAVGGPVLAGHAYDVGMGEKYVPSNNGRILSRSDAMKAMGGGGGSMSVTIKHSPLLEAMVEETSGNVARSNIQAYDRVVGDRVKANIGRYGE